MIAVSGLTKKYGELVAVRDLSFRVEQGKIWGLLGPNAAGKTTTMRILTGFLPATEGTASVGGLDIFEKPNEVKRILGYLPEILPLYPDMTVSEYLAFVAAVKQVPSPRRREAVEKSVRTTGLDTVKGRLIRNISRGYKQRVGIAQALIHDPQVIILDEPTIGLDPAQIIEIRSLIKSLRGERTIILSTHILAEVTQTCDGVVIINEGRLMASGSLEELTAAVRTSDGAILRVRRDSAAAAERLRSVPGVDAVSPAEDGLRLEWKPGLDPRDEIVRRCLDGGFGVLEMRPLALNIEDLYLRIVTGGTEQ
ncbi:MAG: ATP-binding cassette domain-containing protein [Candidatus Aminicenantes bacterium]|nr:ATP-binding cassette domain-containing protein [Candidatus Aminicenantes bacterium]